MPSREGLTRWDIQDEPNTKSQPAPSPSSRPCGVILSSMGISICTCNVWLSLMYIGAWEMWKMPVGVELSWSILRNSHRPSYLLGFAAGRMYNLHARWPSPLPAPDPPCLSLSRALSIFFLLPTVRILFPPFLCRAYTDAMVGEGGPGPSFGSTR